MQMHHYQANLFSKTAPAYLLTLQLQLVELVDVGTVPLITERV